MVSLPADTKVFRPVVSSAVIDTLSCQLLPWVFFVLETIDLY